MSVPTKKKGEEMDKVMGPGGCGECGNGTVYPVAIDYQAKRKLNGELIETIVPNLAVQKCSNCDTIWLTSGNDSTIWRAILKNAGYLLPEEIKAIRLICKLSKDQMADWLKVEVEEIELFEAGHMFLTKLQNAFLRGVDFVSNRKNKRVRPRSSSATTNTVIEDYVVLVNAKKSRIENRLDDSPPTRKKYTAMLS